MDEYILLLDGGIALAKLFLGRLRSRAPVEILSAGQAFIDSLEQHRNDELTKANFEKARG